MDNNQNTFISAGEVVVLTSGDYSDYGINGYLVAIKSFDIKAVARVFIKNKGKDFSVCYRFIAYLISNELAIPVAHREIHLGSYDELLGMDDNGEDIPEKPFTKTLEIAPREIYSSPDAPVDNPIEIINPEEWLEWNV